MIFKMTYPNGTTFQTDRPSLVTRRVEKLAHLDLAKTFIMIYPTRPFDTEYVIEQIHTDAYEWTHTRMRHFYYTEGNTQHYVMIPAEEYWRETLKKITALRRQHRHLADWHKYVRTVRNQ